MKQHSVLVIGAGSWGTALAILLARKQYQVYLWGHNSTHIKQLQAHRCNEQYLRSARFPPTIHPIDQFEQQLDQCNGIVLAVPCEGFRQVINMIADSAQNNLKLCIASKGLESDTRMLMSQVVEECLGKRAKIAVLSGPSFAAEVVAEVPCAVVIAGQDQETVAWFTNRFHSPIFRVYTQDDVIGVQLAAATKNVIAIAAGVADGLGYGSGTRAALITRGLAEMVRLGLALGGHQETFMGLAGLGDMILTCTDDLSRNRRFGIEIAKGATVQGACKHVMQVVEGARTAHALMQLATHHHVEMPITEQVCKLVKGEITAQQAVETLLSREAKQETN